jgi:Spy/CpxP family protein refolding chaperone
VVDEIVIRSGFAIVASHKNEGDFMLKKLIAALVLAAAVGLAPMAASADPVIIVHHDHHHHWHDWHHDHHDHHDH